MPDNTTRFNLAGKCALVTGASRGLGAEIAAALASAGADVGIVGRDAEGLAKTRRAIEEKGRQCVVIEADLRTVEGVRAAGAQALEAFTTVDVLVNNAGIFHRQSILETTLEQWEETQAVNIRAPFLLSQAVAPGMIAQRAGKIIHISSLASVMGFDGHAAYSATKGAMNLLTKVMAAEWGPHNIQTNAVAPGIVLTEMGEQVWGDEKKSAPVKARIPLRRFGMPPEIAELVLYLASPASDYVCGQVILIDGGYSAV